MHSNTPEPDYKFDGYVVSAGGERFPCDVQIWLPSGPEGDASIAVFMDKMEAAVQAHGPVSLVSAEAVETLGMKFKASDLFVSTSRSQTGFRGGGAELTVTHIGHWCISHANAAGTAGDTELKYVSVSLSPLRYAARRHIPAVSYTGTREVKFLEPAKRLTFCINAGENIVWELEESWTWKTAVPTRLAAFSTPTLRLASASHPLTITDLSRLTAAAKDTCTLLTLAARHRVAPHVVAYNLGQYRTQEWEYPLRRLRSLSEEEAAGPLVAVAELERYFEAASTWWSSLDSKHRDAARLAVFSMHGTTDTTLESQAMSRFAALEALARLWGTGDTAGARFNSMATKHGVTAGGLWPMYDKASGQPLYWLRNEIAHGGGVANIAGVLPLAADHLQLWIETVLLALMGFQRQDRSDWLTRVVPRQQQELAKLRAALPRGTP